MAPALLLFDDIQARQWEPFALTRPAGELRFGALKLVERAEQALGVECIGYITAEHLHGFSEPDARPVVGPNDFPSDRDLILWCSRGVADFDRGWAIPDGPAAFQIDGAIMGLRLPKGGRPDPAFLNDLVLDHDGIPHVDVAGRVLERVWDLMVETPEQMLRDLASAPDAPADALPRGAYRIGSHELILGADVDIEPGTVFDTREGPIQLGDGVQVKAGTRLAGPAAIGPRSRLLGGSFESISAGPYSYIHGEIAETVILGYTNKAHDGFLGHAYLGKWVNLGAMTTNSDLKNNYGPVRVWTPSGMTDTGHTKVGCFLGDHVKTGIGMLLNTGTVVGAGANLYGSVMPPSHVEPFSWGQGDNLTEYRLAKFIDTARVVMARRGVELDERGQQFLEACWRKGRGG